MLNRAWFPGFIVRKAYTVQLNTTNRLLYIQKNLAFVCGLDLMSEINLSTPKQPSEIQTTVYDECSAMASLIMDRAIITVRHTEASP